MRGHTIKCEEFDELVVIQLTFLFSGNILKVSKEVQGSNEEEFDLKLIDFEYSAYNYRWVK